MKFTETRPHSDPKRASIYHVIFGIETPAGQAFDVCLLWAIVLSVIVVMLESVAGIRSNYGTQLRVLEWLFTGLFTVEYIYRLYCVKSPLNYARSFFGIVDVLSIIPTYLSLFLGGAHTLLVIRALRLLRVFRVFQLGRFVKEAKVLVGAFRSSREKILVFFTSILIMVIIAGAVMYLIEGSENGFTSIPRSIYWAIVTMTTVGFGDITPKTILGQCVASLIMLMGYAIIAVPTGIVTAELTAARKGSFQVCPHCDFAEEDSKSKYCRMCSHSLDGNKNQ